MKGQLRLFALPEDEAEGRSLMRITLGAELPGPGYDSMVIELLADILRRLEHDGLFPGRISVEADVGYLDAGYPPPA